MPDLDYEADRYCPAYERKIDCDLCYESLMALTRFIKIEAVPELKEIKDIEKARVICDKCPYSDLG